MAPARSEPATPTLSPGFCRKSQPRGHPRGPCVCSKAFSKSRPSASESSHAACGEDNSQLTRVCKQAPRPHCSSFNHVSPLHPAPRFTSASLQGEVAAWGIKQPAIQRSRGGHPLARPPPPQRAGAGCLRFRFLGLEVMFHVSSTTQGFPGGSDGKESACRAGDLSLDPGSRRSPGEGNGHPLQNALPGEAHGQRSLVGFIQSMGSQRVGHD